MNRLSQFSLVAICLFSTVACQEQVSIVHDLSEFQANEILVVLDSIDIEAKKMKAEGREVTWSIAVPSSHSAQALNVLVNNRLPRENTSGLADVYPPGGGGMIPTATEEQAKFLMAVQGEIDKKLLTLPGIVRAHTSVVVPNKDVIRDLNTPPPPATASVAVVYNPTANGSMPVDNVMIGNIVAYAVEDLKPENVKVLMSPNTPIQLLTDPIGGSARSSIQTTSVFGIDVLQGKNASRFRMVILSALGLAAISIILFFIIYLRYAALKRNAPSAQDYV